ncbi:MULTISPECIES: OmpA family protein [Psychrobacter]|jgi:OOP family OmpA-OmpF porin|uniref:OmpA family protein n=1 Tax=Psychrobacter TaxID=497 RepID=UPI000E9760B4|nr:MULTISPECIES: OmpA family protein [Psychrobacter]HBL97604.1 flagellar motor protein MotB [Psychrobacter sp.]
MKTQLGNAFLILVSALALSACQTSVSQNQATQNINAPVAKVILDSDGDGVLDAMDECPRTPHNMVIDERGCPHSLLFAENEFRMEARAYYDENSSEIKSEYYEQLDNAGKKMQDHLDAIMRVEGHISKREDSRGNQTLSRYRVEGIKNYIVMKYNIDPARIETSYYGSERPIAPNDAENSWLNQRIYVLISNVE